MKAKSIKGKSAEEINKRMKSLIVFTVITLLSACTTKQPVDTNSQLVGMYKLLIIENQDSTGAWHEQEWGKGGDGYIIYDGKGHMAVQITPKGYKDFQWLDEESSINQNKVREKTDSMSVDELKAAVREFVSNYVYTASYTIEDSADVVIHHRISSTIPAIWGTTVRRSFSFSGDTLILKNLNVNRRLKWIKQK
jgi:Lipocalin-like domain